MCRCTCSTIYWKLQTNYCYCMQLRLFSRTQSVFSFFFFFSGIFWVPQYVHKGISWNPFSHYYYYDYYYYDDDDYYYYHYYYSLTRSKIAMSASSWLDDYFSWIEPNRENSCCRIKYKRNETCFRTTVMPPNSTNTTTPAPAVICYNETTPVVPYVFCNATGECLLSCRHQRLGWFTCKWCGL